MDKFLGYFQELWHNQPATVLGSGIVILILFGIYIFLLNIYK
tara:strand:+ start:195 stop:320 length:126 start_codon:yes stop_codon:yes gene_type:complete